MDSELVIRAQRGDEEAFASLAVTCGDRLHAVAHRILRDVELAEDASQQVLLAIWQNLPQVRDPARFEARKSGPRPPRGRSTGSSTRMATWWTPNVPPH